MLSGNTERDETILGPRRKFALTMARRLLKGAGITSAPVSLQRVIEYAQKDRKLTVVTDRIPGQLSGIMVKVGELDEASTFIGINADQPWCRRRFTLGHELGHMFMEHTGCGGGGDPHHEREADVFAAELLIPSALIKTDLEITPNIPSLAKRYRVSEQALSIKLRESRLL